MKHSNSNDMSQTAKLPFKKMPSFKHIQYRDQYTIPRYNLEKNLAPLINTTQKNFDPYFQSRNMVQQQLMEEERNQIDFYKIKEVDKVRAKKRDNTDFRSIHYITDKPIAASQNLQLFQYKDVTIQKPKVREPLNSFQKESRQELKCHSQDQQLLMNEIYQKLDEVGVTKDFYEQKNKYHQKDEDDLRDNLDAWSTQNNAFYKKQKEKPKFISQFKRKTEKRDSILLNNTISKVKSSIVGILTKKGSNSSNIPGKKNSIRVTGGNSPLGIIANLPIIPSKSNFLKNAMNTGTPRQDGSSDNSRQEGHGQAQNREKRKSLFKEAFTSAIEVLQSRKGVEMNGSEDRDVKKKLASYMNAVPDGEGDNPKNVNIDLSSLQIANSLQQRLELETQHNGIRHLSRFYEKQTVIIENKLNQKIREIEVYIQNKTNTIRLLRTENHSHQNKLRIIDNKTIELQSELAEGPRKKKQQNVLNNSSMNLNSPDKSELSLNRKKSQNRESQVVLDNRSQLIDKFMTNNNWENDLKDSIENQKKLKRETQEKIDINNEQIFTQQQELQEKRKVFKDLEKSRKIFYFELLKIGKDCRQDGITWVLQHIYKQGEKIDYSQLPNFLDQKAKDYIFFKTQKQMELQELMSIQDMQMDVYKQNIQNQILEQQQQRSHQNSQQMENSHYSQNSAWASNNNNHYNILDQQASILQSEQQHVTHNHGTNSINSIIGQSRQQVTQNLSVINVSQVKQVETDRRKKSKIENLQTMLPGLTEKEKSIVNVTINQLTSPKITSNNIFYEETIKKMRENFRVQKTIVPPKTQKAEDQMSEYEESFSESEIVQDIEEIKPEPMRHNILLYDNDIQMNNYETKQEFFMEQRNLNSKIVEKQKEIKQIEDAELYRIIKEFDFKNYLGRFKTKYAPVLCALFGAFKAEREIVRNGLKEK